MIAGGVGERHQERETSEKNRQMEKERERSFRFIVN